MQQLLEKNSITHSLSEFLVYRYLVRSSAYCNKTYQRAYQILTDISKNIRENMMHQAEDNIPVFIDNCQSVAETYGQLDQVHFTIH